MTLDDVRQMGIILGRNALESAPVSKETKWVQEWVNKNLKLEELDRRIMIDSATNYINKERYQRE